MPTSIDCASKPPVACWRTNAWMISRSAPGVSIKPAPPWALVKAALFTGPPPVQNRADVMPALPKSQTARRRADRKRLDRGDSRPRDGRPGGRGLRPLTHEPFVTGKPWRRVTPSGRDRYISLPFVTAGRQSRHNCGFAAPIWHPHARAVLRRIAALLHFVAIGGPGGKAFDGQ